jgi:hypothetical protein
MKKTKIMFWVTTGIIFIMEGVLPAFTSQTDMAVQGITHLGYPVYFGTMLAVFKVLGSLVLIFPQAPARIKEWAYAGFGIDFISAFVSIVVVDGFGVAALLPLVFMILLVLSYRSYRSVISQTM